MAEARMKAPKFAKVYDDLQALIRDGEYPLGSLLPTESELCQRFKVSRYTLREALAQLERQGLIERKRRAGTRVVSAAPRNVFRHATGSRSDLLEFVKGTTIELSPPRLIETDGRLARLLGCDELRQWYLMEGVRVDAIDGRPIGVTQLYVDATRATLPPDADFGRQPVYEWLDETHGIRTATVSQDISAVSLGETEARALGERPAMPALKILRRYFDPEQRIFQISVTMHRSADFVYNTRLHLG